ncbi:hypothetical protein MNV49_007748 [Pseudohyphozyma bogoriensis]|nr:hypothetical protein MNV49_007748 [Pseudohyphozyma bogoriensis]
MDAGGSRGDAGNWEDTETGSRRREADLLSLHEGVGAPRRRFRGRGGDISGGGASNGSGLSRLILLKTLWRGLWSRDGAVRLPDSDDEDERLGNSDEEEGLLAEDDGSGSTNHDHLLVDTNGVSIANGRNHAFDSSRHSPATATSPVLFSVGEDEGMDGGAEMFASKSRRSKRRDGDDGSSKGSHSGAGDLPRRGSSTSSSSHSRTRSLQHSYSASQVPLPSSPATSIAPSLHSSEGKRSNSHSRGHKSHPSISSTSTSSSGKRRSKKKHRAPFPGQPEEFEGGNEGGYYQDENGQLQPYPSSYASPHAPLRAPPSPLEQEGQWFEDEAGQQFFVPAGHLLPATDTDPYPSSPLEYSLPPGGDYVASTDAMVSSPQGLLPPFSLSHAPNGEVERASVEV